MKKLFVFILLLFPCGIFAQEDYEAIIQQQDFMIDSLQQDIELFNDSIAKRKKELYNLKLSWYRACVEYLKAGTRSFNSEELGTLIRGTKREVDGDALYNELLRARNCFDAGEPYTYKDVTPPSEDDWKLNVKGGKGKNKKSSSKKPDKKNSEEKKPEKEGKKDPNPPVVPPKNPAKPVVTPEVTDKPIESDPNKDKPGDEKTVVKTPVQDENPPVEPDSPKKSDTNSEKKSPKRVDKGEMDEGMRKKTKNNDGSN